jgi:hypothetical protein
MGVRETLEVLERVNEVATLAGIVGKIDEGRLLYGMRFDLDAGRSQVVYVRNSSRDADHKVITMFSPCLVVKKGFFNGFSKERALDLLRKNEMVLFARYGIWERESETMVVASVDHLLETLDPPEYRASAYHVAMAADLYERENGGKDNF